MFYYKSDDNIGNFKVKFPIKESEYAQTYRVINTQGKNLFLKLFIHSQLIKEQFDKNWNILEIEVSKQINHKNITKYVDSGEFTNDNGKFSYMVYEFISGETVAQKIARQGSLTVYESKEIIKTVLEGVKYLHTSKYPLIHNDITTKNIMLDLSVQDKYVAKIIDLGHTCFYLNDRTNFNKLGLSPFYVAPEMMYGIYSPQSDLYSVGASLYHMLFGMPPWFVDISNMNNEEKENAVRRERENPLKIPNTNKVFELDNQLLNILRKSMANDVGERFQTADEFLKALNNEISIKLNITSNNNKTLKDNNSKENEKLSNLSSKKGNGFKDIIGLQDLKDTLQLSVIDFLKNPEKYKRFKLDLPNGMLLYGPPGCGKTFFAEKFAEETGYNFQKVISSDLASIYVHGTQQQIAEVFNKARKNAPTILYFDEINAMVPNRDNSMLHNGEQGEVNEFLSQLDNCGQKGIFVIASTNYPNQIDRAVLRAGRLEKHYYIPLPDYQMRKGMFKLYLEGRPVVENIDYDELAGMTNNYVSSSIKMIVDDAALLSIKHSKEMIDMEALKEAIKNEHPLPDNEISKYLKIKEEFESNKYSIKGKIGFKQSH